MNRQLILVASNQYANTYVQSNRNEGAEMGRFCHDVVKYCSEYYDFEILCFQGCKDNLQSQIDYAERWPKAVILSIHSNAGGGTGVEGFYHSQSPEMNKIMSSLCNRVALLLGLKVRRVEPNDGLAMLRGTPVEGLIELFFHDSTDDLKKYDANYIRLVKGFSECLVELFGNNQPKQYDVKNEIRYLLRVMGQSELDSKQLGYFKCKAKEILDNM